jgi:hypothetical protein
MRRIMMKSTISSLAAALVAMTAPLAVAATNHSGTMARSGSSTPGIDKTQAMKEIQTDGYTNVKDLRKEKGAWTATAMESGKPVSLRVDNLGNVRKE